MSVLGVWTHCDKASSSDENGLKTNIDLTCFVIISAKMEQKNVEQTSVLSSVELQLFVCVCPAGPVGGVGMGMGVDGQWHYM